MKKRTLIVIVLFISCASLLFAGSSYLRPMLGAAGIPMNPARGQNGSNDYRYTPIVLSPGFEPFRDTSTIPKGCYTVDEMIALGGFEDMGDDEALQTELMITATCDKGFFFVSQSNPSYRRPFELYIIPKASRRDFASAFKTEAYGQKAEVLSSNNQSVRIKYTDIMSPSYDNDLWFDMVLVLPGKMQASGDVLVDDNKFSYPLTVADDYSAVVNISIVPYKNGIEDGKAKKTISIPFTGYYEPTPGFKHTDHVSIFIHSLPAASNISMKNYGLQPIASIKILGVYEKGQFQFWKEAPQHAYGLFLSSSSNPYEKGKPFKLVKDGVVFPDTLTPNNSVAFDVVLTDSSNTSKTYNGEDHITTANDAMTEGFTFKPGKNPISGGHRKEKTYLYEFDGVASVRLHNNSGVLMEAGRYQSSIYVHIIDTLSE